MTIRQNYIDDFKTYCKMKGYIEQENKTEYLFTAIQSTLNDLGYQECSANLQSNKTIYTYIKPNHSLIYGIKQKSVIDNQITTSWSWSINKSSKLHNNTTMICYLMHKLLTK